jgi:hypothetical protein
MLHQTAPRFVLDPFETFAMSGVRVDQLLASATIVLLVLAAGELTGSMSVGRGGARFPEYWGHAKMTILANDKMNGTNLWQGWLHRRA